MVTVETYKGVLFSYHSRERGYTYRAYTDDGGEVCIIAGCHTWRNFHVACEHYDVGGPRYDYLKKHHGVEYAEQWRDLSLFALRKLEAACWAHAERREKPGRNRGRGA